MADSSSATPWRWEGFRTLERLHSGHMTLLCRPWAHVSSGPNESCAYLYLMPNAEGPFFFPIQNKLVTKNHSVCPLAPPLFLELKSMSFGSPCIIGRVSTVPQDTVVENIWNFPTLQEKGLGTVGGLGLVFSVSRGCQAVCRHIPRNGCLPGGIPCLLPKPVRLR